MEIDIQIRGATPTEAQKVLKGIVKEEEAPVPGKVAPVKKTKKPRGKYQIPFSAVTQKKDYQNARNLCIKHQLPYSEALKKQQEEEPDGGAGETPKELTLKTLDTISPNDVINGLKVRQIKPDGGREKMCGIGIVTARKAGLIEVRDGNGKKHMLDARCLAIDTTWQQPSDRARGASS